MTTGSVGWVLRIAFSASSPDISGISMSMVTTSGSTSGSFCSAIKPFAAVPTTSSIGSVAIALVRKRRTTVESSTTSTFTFTSPAITPPMHSRRRSRQPLRWLSTALAVVRAGLGAGACACVDPFARWRVSTRSILN